MPSRRPPSAATPSRDSHVGKVSVSIVSHGSDACIASLLSELSQCAGQCIAEVILTHNLPPKITLDSENTPLPFRLIQITNPTPLGFGANHNRAFAKASAPFFCVLNPDIEKLCSDIWPQLIDTASQPHVGCAYPTLLNSDGTPQTNERAMPTPWALLRRRILRQPERRIDWVSAAFWVTPSEVFAALKGFDSRYFMYCEDVDFCLRLQLQGWHLQRAPTRATHHAQHDSHRQWRPLLWHIRRLLRLWGSAPFWKYLRKIATKPGHACT